MHISHSSLRITKPASRAYVRVNRWQGAPLADDDVSLDCDEFLMEGRVDLAGRLSGRPNPDDNRLEEKWRIGFSQLNIRTTSRAYYRGRTVQDGSVSVREDRPPALRAGASRDSSSRGDPFTYYIWCSDTLSAPVAVAGAPARSPPPYRLNELAIMVGSPSDRTSYHVSHSDSPRGSYNTQQLNPLTNRHCLLHSILMEWQFVTVLMALSYTDQVFHQLKHVYWNVHWDATFDRVATPAGDMAKARVNTRNTRMAFGPVLDGAPADARFRELVTLPSTPTSASRAQHAHLHPVIEPSHTW